MTTLQALYHALETDRSSFLERAYRSSILTCPSVLPREGLGRDKLPQNYQSIGSAGINNLSSKLMLTLFPHQLPFFRLTVDPFTRRELILEAGEQDAAQAEAEITKNLSLIEEVARNEFEVSGWRPVMSEAMKHLVVSGNGLIFDEPSRGPQFIDLRSFVVERDPEGNLLKTIVRQKISREDVAALFGGTVPEDLAGFQQVSTNSPSTDPHKFFDLFTGAVKIGPNSYKVWQEIGGRIVGKSKRRTKDTLPLIPIRFTMLSGENYGAGYVEEYDGDLLSLEMLSRALNEGAQAAAKLLILVRPGAIIRPQAVATAPNGAIRSGEEGDVSAFRLDKQADFAVARQQIVDLSQRLQMAFLMVSQRNAERVTAEEVRITAQQLEDALGGVYSSLAHSVQRPVVNYMLAQMKKRSDIPALPPGVQPIVATGLEAISRGHTANRLLQLGQISQQILGPEVSATAFNSRAVLSQLATALNLDPDSVLRSEEEIQAEQTAGSNQDLVSQLGPEVIRQLGNQAQAQ